ncbi:hypothetical protein HU200_053301 [Digitaria exilis]|uniref:Uncharacterized protein n=1 Tax=Digitaria exilis TaxID=1010633 RepID=A0A835APM9_9POAL|nr:hypothetical protein HU200_053301 [Digitaria exilis]CAB3459914.1 unnamed protein product [Digitaria exilis]
MQDHKSAYIHRSGEHQLQAAPSTCDLAAAVDDVVPANGHHHKPGKAVTASVYRAKIAGHSRVVTVSWSRDLLSHAFTIAISGADGASAECRVELRPWQFWRRAGSRRVELSGGASTAPATVRVLWDLRRARFAGAGIPEPRFGYFVALEAAGEVVLVHGDLRRDALRRAAPCAAADAEAVPVARREHVFGRRRFAAKARFHDHGDVHDIAIECGGERGEGDGDMEMSIAIDGEEAVQVKHLQWKFRGNQSVTFSRAKVEVYWDVHDWLFSAGTRPALFIFRPIVLSSSSAPAGMAAGMLAGTVSTTGGFCLYLYAWKLD